MEKRLQVVISEETWHYVNSIFAKATEEFQDGTISLSNVVDEMLLNSKVDIGELQSKHVDRRKLIINAAKEENPDYDLLIKRLTELRGRQQKRQTKKTSNEGEPV